MSPAMLSGDVASLCFRDLLPFILFLIFGKSVIFYLFYLKSTLLIFFILS